MARIKQVPVLVDIAENVFRDVIKKHHAALGRKRTKPQKSLVGAVPADAEIGDAAFELGSKY